MKKYAILLLVLLVHLTAFAVPACPDSLCIVQPNGDTLWTYLHGDEFYHWRTTIDGHVITRNTNNYFHYAIIESDSLRPSEQIAHNVENRSISEQEYIDSFSSITKQFIQAEIHDAYTLALNDTLLFPPAQHAASNYTASQPIVGTRKVLTILMEFEDRKFTNTRVVFDSLMNQRNGAIGPNQGSVRKYYHENSYGQMTIETTVVGPFEAENPHTEYQRKQGGNNYKSEKLVQEAIQKAQSVVNFSTLDGNNDGYVDCVHIIYAGTKYVNNSSTDVFIWPYKYSISTTSINGKKVRDYIMTPELADDKRLAPIGTICHELGHILGAPDYYDASNCFYAMGYYDVMERGSWANSGYSPSHHNPYTKCYIFGWDTPKLINAETNNYKLSSVTTNKGHFYRINTSTDGEYFLLENRTKEQFDTGIPNGGLLFYHIHKNLEACVSSWDSINNAHPLKLYLVNALASSDPNSSPSSYGSFNTSRAYPGNSGNKTMFTNTSIPSAKAWDGSETDVNICFIQKDSNGDITFTVNPEIQGPSQLCGTRDYCVTDNIPITDIVMWSYYTDIAETSTYPALRFLDGTEGECVAIERGNTIQLAGPILPGDTTLQVVSYGMIPPVENPGIPHVGTATLYATVHGGNGTYQMEKNIVLPEYATPSVSVRGHTLWRVNRSRILLEDSCSEIDSEYIKWYVQYPNAETEEEFTGRSVTLRPTETGEMTVRIVNDCGCGSNKETTYTFTVVNTGLFYSNPITTSNLEVDILNTGETDGLYTIEIWHEAYGCVRHITTQDNNEQINVSDLPNGWYQIVLRKDGQLIDSGNIVINN